MPQAAPTVPSPRHARDTYENHCPYLLEAASGTYILRGRARFPEGVTPPTFIASQVYSTGPIPDCHIAWHGESFVARFVGARWRDIAAVQDALCFGLYEQAQRPREDGGECRYRIDHFEWVAPDKLEDQTAIGGTVADLLCEDGVPVAVEFKNQHPDDFARVRPAFKAIFCGRATLGEWDLTARDKGHFDGRALVQWHPPQSWQPEATELRRS